MIFGSKTLLFLGLVLLISGCAGYKIPETSFISTEDIRDEVKVGCRSPNEPGCESCLVHYEGSCTKLASQTNSTWYNVIDLFNSSCEDDLPACAQCSEREEKNLISFFSSKNFGWCDCNSVEINRDPCFFPDSCGCLCQRYNHLSNECPLKTDK